MKQAHKKRPSRATAFCMPVLLDMGGYFINLENVILLMSSLLYVNNITTIHPCKRNRIGTKSVF